MSLAVEILHSGDGAIPRSVDDLNVAARTELVSTGVITAGGAVIPGRAAELVIVCQVLAAMAPATPNAVPEPRLVLSAPSGTAPVADWERLDTFVLDTIRQSTTCLHIGGAFWNEAGFELLEEVLLPAVCSRHVRTTVYVNAMEPEYAEPLTRRLGDLVASGPVSVRWFTGPRPTMLHAKFVIRDRSHGYLGTANLTSWGMSGHIEAGVELTTTQSRRLVQFLGQLEASGLFTEVPPL
jgi:hypothetical protein